MSENFSNNYKYPKDIQTPKRKWWQRLIALLIILVIFGAGWFVAKRLDATKPQARRKPPVKMQALVKVEQLAPISTNVKIHALGRVIPAQEINLQAQVGGRVEYIHPLLTPGGIIKTGDVLLRLEKTDYKLSLQHKLNMLAQAKADLRIEEGNQAVARQEWELIKNEGIEIVEASEDLVLRKPQLEKAKANISVAETDLDLARINLERTSIKAPFNAVVRQKNVDLGSLIGSQSSIAVLAGIDLFWAEVSVPVDKLAWIDLPGGDSAGSKVIIHANNLQYSGFILKLLPDIDQDGLMARLLLGIKNPMATGTNKTPLLLGSFVEAEIVGKKLTNVFQLPRAALFDENSVLTVMEENTLHIQPVSVIWKNEEYVFIDDGLYKGDSIIVSNVPAPIEGMPVNTNGGRAKEGNEPKKGKGNDRR